MTRRAETGLAVLFSLFLLAAIFLFVVLGVQLIRGEVPIS